MTREAIIEKAKRICLSSNPKDYIEFVGELAKEEENIPSDLKKAAEESVLRVFEGYRDMDTPLRTQKIDRIACVFHDGRAFGKKEALEEILGHQMNSDEIVCLVSIPKSVQEPKPVTDVDATMIFRKPEDLLPSLQTIIDDTKRREQKNRRQQHKLAVRFSNRRK